MCEGLHECVLLTWAQSHLGLSLRPKQKMTKFSSESEAQKDGTALLGLCADRPDSFTMALLPLDVYDMKMTSLQSLLTKLNLPLLCM